LSSRFSNYYTQLQIDTKLGDYAFISDLSNFYSKSEVNTKLSNIGTTVYGAFSNNNFGTSFSVLGVNPEVPGTTLAAGTYILSLRIFFSSPSALLTLYVYVRRFYGSNVEVIGGAFHTFGLNDNNYTMTISQVVVLTEAAKLDVGARTSNGSCLSTCTDTSADPQFLRTFQMTLLKYA